MFYKFSALTLTLLSFTSCISDRSLKGTCYEQAETAAVKKLIGNPALRDYKILQSKYYGQGVEALGNLKLHLYTVEISDEADGAVMVAFVKESTCRVHDTQFGTHALAR